MNPERLQQLATDMRLGDCLDVLPTLEAGSVHCCVTSPPYWGLRDYGVDSQLGLEATPEEYVAKMVEVFRAVRRVLRDDGTLWLNLGDSFNSAGTMGPTGNASITGAGMGFIKRGTNTLKPKDLCGIPWAVAFALRADGWYLRSDIIWHKSNPMPESCTDRPTKSHEYLFLLTKSPKYFYDADAIREPALNTGGNGSWGERGDARRDPAKRSDLPILEPGKSYWAGRNKRSVWTISTQAFPGAHFATFPEKLVLPCILAGTSEEGCCAECGAPWERVVELGNVASTGGSETSNRSKAGAGGTREWKEVRHAYNCGGMSAHEHITTGWQPTCTCGPDTVPCTVLDPFLGSGTTAKVAQQYGRSFVGCELSAEYLELARDRFKQPRLFA